jgi:hypothetical protein
MKRFAMLESIRCWHNSPCCAENLKKIARKANSSFIVSFPIKFKKKPWARPGKIEIKNENP